jgi:hypothetical protein
LKERGGAPGKQGWAQLPAESIVAHHNATLQVFARVAASEDILQEWNEWECNAAEAE